MNVVVKITGEEKERLINSVLSEGHTIHSFYEVEGEWYASMSLKTFRKMRSKRRRYKCRINVERRIHPAGEEMTNNYVMVSFMTMIVVLFLLSNMIWAIDIKGLSDEGEFAVREDLRNSGYYVGGSTFFDKSFSELESRLLKENPELIWLTIAKKGTALYIQASEADPPVDTREEDPADLVAAEEGTVVRMIIREGQPVVEANQFVKKGQVLVSGKLNEDTYVKASGEVTAETWYSVEMTERKEAWRIAENDEETVKHFLSVGNLKIPIWGFFTEAKGEWEEREHSFQLWGYDFPVTYRKRIFLQANENKLEMKDRALTIGKNHLLSQLEKGAVIKDEKVLHQYTDSGKVKLILLYQVHENIAKTKYINQGD